MAQREWIINQERRVHIFIQVRKKYFYDTYKQRMHRSGRGLLNTKKRTEEFMQVCFVGFLGGKKHKKLQSHLIDPYHFDASCCSKLG